MERTETTRDVIKGYYCRKCDTFVHIVLGVEYEGNSKLSAVPKQESTQHSEFRNGVI
jgi:hypothetical protein